jgi:hypothetical protein
MSSVNTADTLAPLLKKVYPTTSPGYVDNKSDRNRRFRKIRRILKDKKK